MSPVLKNILAVLAGIVVGMIVNMGIVMIGPMLVPLPEGIDPMDPESLKAGMHLLETKHYVTPFIAHALGTLAGAFTASKIAASHGLKLALGIGAFFLLGGIYNVVNLDSPTWFSILDLVVAYIPMAWLGHNLAGSKT